MKKAILALLIGLVVLPAFAGEFQEDQFCAVGERAPSFKATSLSGAEFRSSSLHGKPVVLNFWATWCASCLAEMPALQRVSNRYRSAGLEVIGIVVDQPQTASVRSILMRARVDYPQYVGTDNVEEEYGADCGLPLTIFIDAKGIVREVHRGIVSKRTLERGVRALVSSHSSRRGPELASNLPNAPAAR